jgi:hypothetical protein
VILLTDLEDFVHDQHAHATGPHRVASSKGGPL